MHQASHTKLHFNKQPRGTHSDSTVGTVQVVQTRRKYEFIVCSTKRLQAVQLMCIKLHCAHYTLH